MINRDIYNAALRLVGEVSTSDSPDYSARSAPLLAIVYNECASLDAAYRAANGLEPSSWSYTASIVLDTAFPFCDIFFGPAAYSLASLLTFDENADLSKNLYQRFSSLIEDIRRGLPTTSEPITDVYHLI